MKFPPEILEICERHARHHGAEADAVISALQMWLEEGPPALKRIKTGAVALALLAATKELVERGRSLFQDAVAHQSQTNGR